MYGPAPYTNSNFALWSDVQSGTIQQGARAGTYSYLARPEIMNYIPVDNNGNLLNPIEIGIATTTPLTPISSSVQSDYQRYANAPFIFGDLRLPLNMLGNLVLIFLMDWQKPCT